MADSAISSDPAASAAPVVPALGRLRLWFATYLLWLGVLFALALLAFGRYDAGQAAYQGWWLLALGTFYLSLCNSLVPLPTAWIVLLLASDAGGLPLGPWGRTGVVAVLATTATVMANLNEYHLLGYMFRARLGDRLRRSQAYRWALRWFDRAPFQTLMLVAFVPIPVDFVRWLAILRRYSRPRYAAAYWLGRLPRYLLMAGVAVVLDLTTGQIIAIQVAIVILLAGRMVYTSLRSRRQRAAQS